MSQQKAQGIAVLCGAATFGLSTNIGGMSVSTGITLAIVVAGVVLLALNQAPPTSTEETSTPSKKKPAAKKTASPEKAPKAHKSPKVDVKSEPKDDIVEAPETPDKSSKKKKKGKKSGGTPISSPPAKPKATPKAEEKEKELSKSQQKKLKKKEAEEKKKVAEEKERAAELARKAAEQKREVAQQKKQQAKARQAAKAIVAETKVETKIEHKQIEVEEGWEVPKDRRNRSKDGKESKEPIVVDVKVAPRAHARVIGLQGENIKKLTEALDVIITMPKRDSGDDLILIKGLPKDVYEAKKAIEELATKGYSSITHPGHTTKPLALQDTKELMKVFGKKGDHFKAIAKATKTTLKMPEKDSGSTTIAITGGEREIENAIAIIQELLDQGYTKVTHPDWVSQEVPVPPESIGAIIGSKGTKLQELMDEHKVKIGVPRREDVSARQDVITVKGPSKNMAGLKKAVAEIVASREVPLEQEVPEPGWQDEVEEIAW